MHRRTALAVCALLLLSAAPATAQSVIDPHAVYEKHCIRCHSEHGADFARLRMKVTDAKLLVRRNSAPVESLLRNHRGVKLADAEQKALVALFISGIRWDGVYQHRCARCHGPAVTFARDKLAVAGDRIVTVAGNRDVGDFLKTHGEATTSEIGLLIDMLRFQIETQPQR